MGSELDRRDRTRFVDFHSSIFIITFGGIVKKNIYTQPKRNLSQEERILLYIDEFGRINRKQVEELLNLSKSRSAEVLNKLVENNIIQKNGASSNTYYTRKK